MKKQIEKVQISIDRKALPEIWWLIFDELSFCEKRYKETKKKTKKTKLDRWEIHRYEALKDTQKAINEILGV